MVASDKLFFVLFRSLHGRDLCKIGLEPYKNSSLSTGFRPQFCQRATRSLDTHKFKIEDTFCNLRLQKI